MKFKDFNWPFYIGTALIVIGVLSLPKCAFGGEANLTWVAPTKNCDGSALTNLTGYDLTYGMKRQALPLTPLALTVKGLAPGTWWFSLAAVTPTARSEFITVEKVIAPEQFVTTSNSVYTFIRSNGNISVVKTNHVVPLGAVCDATQSVNGKHKVRLEDVVWMGAKLSAALADCG